MRLKRLRNWRLYRDGRCGGGIILGALRQEQLDPAGASESLARTLQIDPFLRGSPASPSVVRKLLARTLLQTRQPDRAKTQLENVLTDGLDPEASWLLSRAYLLTGNSRKGSPASDFGGRLHHRHIPSRTGRLRRCQGLRTMPRGYLPCRTE